jgi:hypothetical protein
MMYPEKYRTDALLQQLLKNNTLDQLLFAFDPSNFRQTPEPLPLYDPRGTGQGGQGGGSYLDQLLGQQGQQAAPQQAAAPQIAPLQQLLEEEARKRNMMLEGGGMMDRQGYGGLGMAGY